MTQSNSSTRFHGAVPELETNLSEPRHEPRTNPFTRRLPRHHCIQSSFRRPFSRDPKRQRAAFLLVAHEHAVRVNFGNIPFLRDRPATIIPFSASERKVFHFMLDSLWRAGLRIVISCRLSQPKLFLMFTSSIFLLARHLFLRGPLFVLYSFDLVAPPSFPVPAFMWVLQRP